ncbi:MAG: hypothetical protein ACETWM_22300 [Candidatus Lokiarchaeia archaeon]
MKKIYTTGPFGESYKIVITDEFLERCLQLREVIRRLDLKDDEEAQITKKVSATYPPPDEEYYRPVYAKIKADVISLGCYWEEGWQTVTDELDYSLEDKTKDETLLYVSLEKLPEVWFQDHFLWRFAERDFRWQLDEKIRNLTYEEIVKLLIDEEDMEVFETKLQERKKQSKKSRKK